MLSGEEREVLDALPGAVVAAGAGGSVLYINSAACALLDYDGPGEVVGQPLTTLMPKRMSKKHSEAFSNYRRTGRSRLLGKRVRVPALRRTGEEIAIELRIRMFRRPDGTDLIIGAMGPAAVMEDGVDMAVDLLEANLVDRAYEVM